MPAEHGGDDLELLVDVAPEMDPAALPGHAAHDCGDRGFQAFVSVGDDQLSSLHGEFVAGCGID